MSDATTPTPASSLSDDDDLTTLLLCADAFDRIASKMTQTSDDRMFAKTSPRRMTINDAAEIARAMAPALRKLHVKLDAPIEALVRSEPQPEALTGEVQVVAWVHECGALGTTLTVFERHTTKAAADSAAERCDFNGRVFSLPAATLEQRIVQLQDGCSMPYTEAEELAIREMAPCGVDTPPSGERMSVPIVPTTEMLEAAAMATFLNDGSLLEMQRRWSGFLSPLRTPAVGAASGARPKPTEVQILELALHNAYKLLDDIAEEGINKELTLKIRKMLPKRFTNSFEHDN